MSRGEQIRFTIRLTRSLQRRGFRGEPVMVELHDDMLLLLGRDAGALRIAASSIARLRLGFDETKYERLYVARLWLVGEPHKLEIYPLERPSRSYGAAMRQLAARIASAQGVCRIERGLTIGSALFIPVAILLVALIAGSMALFAWVERPLWQRVAFAASIAALVPAFVWRAFRLEVPRPVSSLGEIDRYLPSESPGRPTSRAST